MRPKSLAKEEALRSVALKIISEEGLENLSMQKLAKAANVSPRTIYIKYEHKEDFLIRLFIEEVLGNYEKAVLDNFSPDMDFTTGIKKLWWNTFHYLKNNKHAFALLRYGKSSPLLNKAFQKANIKEGQFFAPIHRFFALQVAAGIIPDLSFDVHRALLLSPVLDLVTEYFDYEERPRQIITDEVLETASAILIKGMLL